MKLKPFHEVIVAIIRNCDQAGLATLEKLIKAVEISSDHNAIVRALRYRRRLAGFKGDDPDGVISSVIQQSKRMMSKCPSCGSSKTTTFNNIIECWNCGRDYPIN